MNNKKIMSILLVFAILLSSFVGVRASGLEVNYKRLDKEGNIEIVIQGEKNRQASVSISDNDRLYYVNNIELDEKGSGKTEKIRLEFNKNYRAKINQDGIEKNLEIFLEEDSSGKDQEDPDDKVEPSLEKKASIYIKGYKGEILNLRKVEIQKRESVLDFTKRLLDANGIKYREKDGYVISIDNQAEFDKGKDSGWMYSVNGKYPNKGADYIVLKGGEKVEWNYTYDLGKDIGAGKNWLKVDEKEVRNIDKILKDLKEKDLKEKDANQLLKDLYKEIDKIESKKVLSKSEEIIEVLGDLNSKAGSKRVSEEIIRCVNKVLETANKKSNKDAYKRLSSLSAKGFNLVLGKIIDIDSNKDREKLSEDLVAIAKLIEGKRVENPLRNKNTAIKISLENDKNYLNEEIVKAIKSEKINEVRFYHKNINFNLGVENLLKNLKIEIENNQGKIKLNLKDGEDKLAIREAIKIEIPSKNKDANIILKDEKGKFTNLGGVYFEKEGLIKAYTRNLGEFYLEENNIKFKDLVNYSWAKDPIEKLASKEIVKGVGNSKFSPESQVTRAEFSAMLVRMLKLDKVNGEEIFKDVTRDKWYYEDINSLYKKGYINGRSEEVFDPNGKISREEMSKILGRILEDYDYQEVDEKVLKEFKDYGKISPWAKDGASILVKNQALKGSGGNFNPKNPGTRAETGSLIYRVYTLILE